MPLQIHNGRAEGSEAKTPFSGSYIIKLKYMPFQIHKGRAEGSEAKTRGAKLPAETVRKTYGRVTILAPRQPGALQEAPGHFQKARGRAEGSEAKTQCSWGHI